MGKTLFEQFYLTPWVKYQFTILLYVTLDDADFFINDMLWHAFSCLKTEVTTTG